MIMTKKKKTTNFPPHLPIFMHKSKILEKIKTNQVTIITGQTGCGKSTQVPKYLLESNYGNNGIIACLHPRCVAAISLAERVSEEINDKLGNIVGYHIRFYKRFCENTIVKFMTTGLMLQMLKDRNCIGDYSVVIIDEAHERSVQTDIVMGVMKEIMNDNKFIKLIIMSATLNIDQIKVYYGNCAVINIGNTKDKIKVIYRPLQNENYISAIKFIVEEILKTSRTGNILIFLQSEEKVFKCKKSLKNLSKTKLLTLFASMELEEKKLVFQDWPGRRKIIISTNVAETSLTIPGVDFVIDSGFVKRVQYDHETGVEKWMTQSISIAEADQRKGRTGRTGNGTCYRLYDEKCVCKPNSENNSDISFEDLIIGLTSISLNSVEKENVKINNKKDKQFKNYPEPEIKTCNLGSMILSLKSMNRIDIMAFPFIVAPEETNVIKSVEILKDLSLLNENGMLTNLGQNASRFPLEPRLAKVATVGAQFECHKDINAIIAMLSVHNVFKSPSKAKNIHNSFSSADGDLFVLRNIFVEAENNRFARWWCQENFINHASINYAKQVYYQLERSCSLLKYQSYYPNTNQANLVKKVFLSGFFHNLARKSEDGKWLTLDNQSVDIHKQSFVEDTDEILMFHSIQMPSESKKILMRNCTVVNKQMLIHLKPQKFKIKAPLWKSIVETSIPS